jgi:hypothetical protein
MRDMDTPHLTWDGGRMMLRDGFLYCFCLFVCFLI